MNNALEKPQWTNKIPGTGMRLVSIRRKGREVKASHASLPGSTRTAHLLLPLTHWPLLSSLSCTSSKLALPFLLLVPLVW